MTPQQLAEARHTIVEKPNIIRVVDRNGNTDSIKTEQIDNLNNNEINNQPHTNTRKSSRLRSTNPTNRYESPITFRLLQVTPLLNGTKKRAAVPLNEGKQPERRAALTRNTPSTPKEGRNWGTEHSKEQLAFSVLNCSHTRLIRSYLNRLENFMFMLILLSKLSLFMFRGNVAFVH